jgi:mono/diheme cytochrome c family protein
MSRVLLSLVVVMALAGFEARAADTGADAPKGDAIHGRLLFAQIGCFQCHGFQGSTGGPGGQLTPHLLPYAAVLAQLRHPRSQMPVYTAAIAPDQDVADIYAYLRSQPAPKPVGEIPLLSH